MTSNTRIRLSVWKKAPEKGGRREPGVSVGLHQAPQALARGRRTEKCSSDKCLPAESVTVLEPFHPRAGQQTLGTWPDRVI